MLFFSSIKKRGSLPNKENPCIAANRALKLLSFRLGFLSKIKIGNIFFIFDICFKISLSAIICFVEFSSSRKFWMALIQ